MIMGQPVYHRPENEQMLREVEERLKTDVSFLKIVHSLMWAYSESAVDDPIVDYQNDGTPITRSQFFIGADSMVEDVKAGNYVTLEELKEKKRTWEESTK